MNSKWIDDPGDPAIAGSRSTLKSSVSVGCSPGYVAAGGTAGVCIVPNKTCSPQESCGVTVGGSSWVIFALVIMRWMWALAALVPILIAYRTTSGPLFRLDGGNAESTEARKRTLAFCV